ncbi:hypothetical protein LIA77_07053 [Sarocladium implicatum]|nr:hypothetical protein LIA77_07053 [Sarocladium implicatum]
MLLQTLLAGLCLATTVGAIPAKHEVVRFKRDAVLSARDLELADMHQVNLTEMYKHSVIKRSDGDHVTIWAHNTYEDLEGPAENPKSKRQTAKLHGGAAAAHWRNRPDFVNCRSHQRWDITSGTSPFTGGIEAIRDWTWDNVGFFLMGVNPETREVYGPGGGWGWRTVLVGGSNSGRNARYRMAVWDANIQYFGIVHNPDIRHDCDWTLDRRRSFNGRWRAAAHGRQRCGIPGNGQGIGQEWQIISWDQNV